MQTGKIPAKPTDQGVKGMKPNTSQRRPVAAKPSPPVKFNVHRTQGK